MLPASMHSLQLESCRRMRLPGSADSRPTTTTPIFPPWVLFLDAELPDGDCYRAPLHNAATVRVVGPGAAPAGQQQQQQRRLLEEEQGQQRAGCVRQQGGDGSRGGGDVGDGGQRQQQGEGEQERQGCSWHAVSVAQVAVGDRLLVLRQPGARHTGVAIEESLTER